MSTPSLETIIGYFWPLMSKPLRMVLKASWLPLHQHAIPYAFDQRLLPWYNIFLNIQDWICYHFFLDLFWLVPNSVLVLTGIYMMGKIMPFTACYNLILILSNNFLSWSFIIIFWWLSIQADPSSIQPL